jgi:hypothetical protein
VTPQQSPTPATPAIRAAATGQRAAIFKRGRRRRAALAAAGLAVFIILWWVLFGSGEISRENYERIEQGMTYEQVEAILGSRGYHDNLRTSDFLRDEDDTWKEPGPEGKPKTAYRRDFWVSEQYVVTVAFDKAGGAVAKSFRARDMNRPSDWSVRVRRYGYEIWNYRPWARWFRARDS